MYTGTKRNYKFQQIISNMDSLIAKLYQSTKTILTNKDLALIWQENDRDNLNAKIAYYVKQKSLIRLTRGVFAKNKDYSSKELATSLYIPSYISFETVLRKDGVIFQHYDTIFVVAKWPKNVTVDKYTITFRKLKDVVLYNSTGIVNKDNYSIATTERAFLDMIYLFPNYYFDNLKSINWEKCDEIAKIYDNKELIKRLAKYRKNYD
jgi:predicted transcriptional regulator of viral defense system